MMRDGTKQPYTPAEVTRAAVAAYDASRWDRKRPEPTEAAFEAGPATLGDFVRFIRDDQAHARYLVERARRSESRDELVAREGMAGHRRDIEPIAPGDPVYEFAEKVFDATDPWQRLAVQEAAAFAGVSKGWAMAMITELRALGCWPYRPGKRGKTADDEGVDVLDLREAA